MKDSETSQTGLSLSSAPIHVPQPILPVTKPNVRVRWNIKRPRNRRSISHLDNFCLVPALVLLSKHSRPPGLAVYPLPQDSNCEKPLLYLWRDCNVVLLAYSKIICTCATA